MARKYLTQPRALALTSGLLLLLCLLGRQPADWLARVPGHLLAMVTAPFTLPLHAIATTLRSPADQPIDFPKPELLQADYLRQQAVIERLSQELLETRQQLAEIAHLRQASPHLAGSAFQPASITALAGDRKRPQLVLNRGTSSGLALQQVVIDGQGYHLVGQISDVGRATATVDLISAPGTSLAVVLTPPPAKSGPAVVQQVTMNDRGAFEVVVTTAAPIEPGYLARLADTRWPAEARGLLLGVVDRLEPWEKDPTSHRVVTILPVRPLASLARVIVIVPAQ